MAAVALLGVTILFWGTAFRASAIGAEHASPVMLTALRAAPAAIVLLAVALLLRSRLPSSVRLWLWTAVAGLLTVTLTFEGIAEGTARAGAGNAAILLNASPFFVLVLARLFQGERTTPVGLAGLVLGFAGIVVMVSTQLGDIEDAGNFFLGMGLALAGAVGWSVGVILTKEMFARHPDLDMLGFTVGQVLVGGVAALALGFGLEGVGGTEWGSADLWGAVAWLAVGSSAIAYLAFFAALRRLPITTVMAWQFLAPVVAVLVEVGRGENPGAVVLAGMCLAIVGVAIVNVAPQLTELLARPERRLRWGSSSAKAK